MRKKCEQKKRDIEKYNQQMKMCLTNSRRAGKTFLTSNILIRSELAKIDAEIFLKWFA